MTTFLQIRLIFAFQHSKNPFNCIFSYSMFTMNVTLSSLVVIYNASPGLARGRPLLSLRGCLHDIGTTFIPARVHSGSLLWLCIRLHDTNTKCHAGANHTGASSPRFLCRSEIFIPHENSFRCHENGVLLFVSYPLKFHQFYGTIRLAPQQTRLYVNTVQLFISPRNESRAVIM